MSGGGEEIGIQITLWREINSSDQKLMKVEREAKYLQVILFLLKGKSPQTQHEAEEERTDY